MTYVIHSYGGGEVLYYIFEGVATILGGSGFISNIMRLSAVIGAVWAMVLMFAQNNPMVGVRWFLWFLAVSNVLFLPKATLYIKDPLTQKLPYKIDNVPLALAAFSGAISGIGQAMTEKIEQVFTLPDYLPYHQTGTVFASKLMSEVHQIKIVDADFNANMERFVNQCVVYDAMIGYKYTLNDLRNCPDVWELVTHNASPVLGFFYKPPGRGALGEVVTCKEGAGKLNKLWKKQIDIAALRYGARFFPQHERTAKIEFLNKLPQSYQLLTAMAGDAQKILQQEMMLNAIVESGANKLSELGGASNYAATKALLQQRTAYQLSGEIAGKILPVMKNVFEAIAYGAFIFIFILALLPNGYTILGTYIGLLLWIQMWSPLYAILNLIMTVAARNQSMGEIGQEGLTMVTSLGFANVNADMAALAGWLSLSIPAISYMITKGGAAAFVHLAGHLGGALQSAASSTAHEVASGNFSLGNVSQGVNAFNNTSAFQHNTAPSYRSGQIQSLMEDGTIHTTQTDGSQVFSGGEGATLSTGSRKISRSNNFSAQASEQVAQADAVVQSKSQEAAEARSETTRQMADLMGRFAKGQTSGEGYSYDASTSSGKSASKFVEFMDTLQKSNGLNEAQAAEVAASVTAGWGFDKFGFKGGVEGKGSFSSNAQKLKAIQDGQNLANKIGYGETVDSVTRAVKDVKFSDHSSTDASLAQGLSASVEKMHRAQEAMTVAEQRSKTYSNIASWSKTSSFNDDSNVTQEVIEFIAAQPVNHAPGGKTGTIGMERAYRIYKENGAEFEGYLSAYGGDVWETIKSKVDQSPVKNEAEFKSLYERSVAELRKSSPQQNMMDAVVNKAAEYGLQNTQVDVAAREIVLQNHELAAQRIAAIENDLNTKESSMNREKDEKMNQNPASIAITNAWDSVGSTAKKLLSKKET